MSLSPEFLRLCRLFDGTLRPFYDLSLDCLTKKLEKELLIALSQVLRRIKLWTDEFGSLSKFDSNDAIAELEGSSDIRVSVDSATSYLDNRHCLASIIGHLVCLFSVNNPFAQHLVGNALLAVSEFVIASGRDWDTFMHLLCLYLELAVESTVSPLAKPCAVTQKYPCNDLLTPRRLLKFGPESGKLYVVSAIIRVLRNIMKYLKQSHDDKIMKTYLDSVSCLFLNIPWGLLCEIDSDRNAEALKESDNVISLRMKFIDPGEIVLFYGNLLQLLCSLVDLSNYDKDGACSFTDIFEMRNLVPKLIERCIHLQSPDHASIFQYFRHKILMLMIKLCSQGHVENFVILSWIHLVHEYFEDLLLHSIKEQKTYKNLFLEGSPFSIIISHPEKQYIMSEHLQRLTVFLFLRLSLKLAGLKEHTDEHYANEIPSHHLIFDINFHSVNCFKCKGLSELQMWIQAHVPVDAAMIHEYYIHRCVRFSMSFLRLFMYEDDILFKMLLQLFCLPSYSKHQIIECETAITAKNHQFVVASDLFNPIHMFHLFLAEILYDHQVLLDYLVSRDTGSSCAEYLLKALRLVCDSWDLFFEFPGVEEGFSLIQSKRQKSSVNQLVLKAKIFPLHAQTRISSSPDHKNSYDFGYQQPFADAVDCLIRLRASIENLNRKNLFPYNPQPLLRRLVIFEKLCIEH